MDVCRAVELPEIKERIHIQMNTGVLSWLKGAAAVMGGIAAYLWGAWDALIAVLICCVVIDYITGVAKAAYKRELSSRVGFVGLLKKMFIFALVALAAQIDRIVPSANGAIRAAVMIFYIANEGLSILENAGAMGLPLPSALSKALVALKKQSGESDETIDTK